MPACRPLSAHRPGADANTPSPTRTDYAEAVKLLQLSIKWLPLERRRKGAAEVVRRARNAAEALRDPTNSAKPRYPVSLDALDCF